MSNCIIFFLEIQEVIVDPLYAYFPLNGDVQDRSNTNDIKYEFLKT